MNSSEWGEMLGQMKVGKFVKKENEFRVDGEGISWREWDSEELKGLTRVGRKKGKEGSNRVEKSGDWLVLH